MPGNSKQKTTSKQPLPPTAKRVFKGIIFDVYQWEQQMFDGSIQTFEKLKRSDTAMVIPVTEDKKIIVLKEEQPAKKPFMSVAGGRVEAGEDIESAAHRELLEETGYQSNDLVLWKAISPLTKIDWTIYFFIARNCQKMTEPKLDSGERIALEYVSFEEFLNLVVKEMRSDSELIISVLEAKLNSEKMNDLKKLFLS